MLSLLHAGCEAAQCLPDSVLSRALVAQVLVGIFLGFLDAVILFWYSPWGYFPSCRDTHSSVSPFRFASTSRCRLFIDAICKMRWAWRPVGSWAEGQSPCRALWFVLFCPWWGPVNWPLDNGRTSNHHHQSGKAVSCMHAYACVALSRAYSPIRG